MMIDISLIRQKYQVDVLGINYNSLLLKFPAEVNSLWLINLSTMQVLTLMHL